MRGFQCPKCDNTEYETGQFRAVGGTLSKIFDVQSQRFTTVTCTRCRYTDDLQGGREQAGGHLRPVHQLTMNPASDV